MVIALSDNEVEEILYHAMPNSWRKNMTEQCYNNLDRSMPVSVENLEPSAPPLAVRSMT